jgi:hypothetical protein
MQQPAKNKRLKIKLATRAAIARLTVLLALLSLLCFWGWFSVFWMPGRSYSGTLPPLQKAEIELANALKQDVTQLATTIGIRNFFEYDRLNSTQSLLQSRSGKARYKEAR